MNESIHAAPNLLPLEASFIILFSVIKVISGLYDVTVRHTVGLSNNYTTQLLTFLIDLMNFYVLFDCAQ